MDPYVEIARQIIASQKKIIGPVAIQEANNCGCVKVDSNLKQVELLIDGRQAIERLVQQYAVLFGVISIELSKVAAKQVMLDANMTVDLPDYLK